MAYPYDDLDTDATNATDAVDEHPYRHNAVAQALNDLKAVLGPDPAGGEADLATRLAQIADAAVPKGLVDAKGDLLVGTADNTVGRLAVGTNGHVLTADSSQAAGVKWAAPASTAVVDAVAFGAGALERMVGSPSFASFYSTSYHGGWFFDPSVLEVLGGANLLVPTGWNTMAVDLWWTQVAGGAGDVVWSVQMVAPSGDGGTLGGSGTGGSITASAPSALIQKRSTPLTGIAVSAGQMIPLAIARSATLAGDTFASDAVLIAVVCRRLT